MNREKDLKFLSKEELLRVLVEQLEANFQSIVQNALEARDAAINEESVAENKYDTRGLEASYLAGAQAKRAMELRREIDSLKKLELKSFSSQTQIGLTALVELMSEDQMGKIFFLLPFAGGNSIERNSLKVMVISPSSPIGRQIMGLKRGDGFQLTLAGRKSEYEVVDFN